MNHSKKAQKRRERKYAKQPRSTRTKELNALAKKAKK